MRKNVSSQSIGVGMTSILSGTDYTNSGAVLTYLVQDVGAIVLGAVNSGICVPRSYGAHHYIAAQSETNFNHILFTFVASGAITRHINVYTERIGVPVGADLATDLSSVQIGVNSLYARVGAPAGANLAVDVSSVAAQVNSNTIAISSLHTRVSSVQTGADNIYARVGAPVGASVSVDVSSIQTQVNSIYFQTNKLQFGGVNRVLSDVTAVNSNASAAANLANGALGLVASTCAAGSTTTSIVTNLTEATNDHYNGRVITFTSGALIGQSTNITDYTGASKTLTVTALTEAPADTDSFVIS